LAEKYKRERRKRTNKYRNRKTLIKGILFDSEREGLRYLELLSREKAGEIHDLKLQEAFEIQPAFKKDGKRYRAIYYISDFSYTENGRRVIEDVKGFKTAVFQLKRKMFEYKYPDLTLKIVE
jgi:hypothetical protein